MANYLDEEGLRKYNQLLQMKFIATGGSITITQYN